MGIREKLFGVGPADPETGVGPVEGASEYEALKKEARKGRGGAARVQEKLELERQLSELEALYEPKNWERIGSLYFDVRFVQTGFETFLLSPEEKTTLSATLSTAIRILVKINPGYLAGFIFLANFGGLIAEKEFRYRVALREQEARTGGGDGRTAGVR